MDDQNKKKSYEKGYDDFFRDRDEASEGGEGINTASASDSDATSAEGQNVKPTYYSYGPYRSEEEQSSTSQPKVDSQPTSVSYPAADKQPLNDIDTKKQPIIIDQQPSYSSTQSQPSQPSYGTQPPQSSTGQFSGTTTSGTTTQLRPFTASNSGERGGWSSKKEPRRTSFKAIFAAFLAGVITVGGLMYAADTQNWFSKQTVSSGVQGSSSGSGSGAKDTGGSSSSGSVVANRPDNIAQLFETASPAVVKIETYQKVSRNNSGSIFDDPFFRQFFGDQGSQQQNESDSSNMQQSGIGTGFFFEESGYILTNQHVVSDSDLINVTVQGYDEPFEAELLGNSYDLDLAVLKITGDQPFPTLPLGSSEDISIGDWVVAIGNPYGFDHTVTVGVISAKERPIEITDTDGTRSYEHLLQTDASINPGNSGGPLLNVNGEVIGINTAVSSQAQGIGFAIPTSTIESVIDNLVKNEEIPKEPDPFIGATLYNVTEQSAQQLGLDKAEGAIVKDVYYNSPAYLGDLKQFDVIVGIDGKSYATTEKLIAEIKSRKVGDTITLNIVRKGEKMDLSITLGDYNEFAKE